MAVWPLRFLAQASSLVPGSIGRSLPNEIVSMRAPATLSARQTPQRSAWRNATDDRRRFARKVASQVIYLEKGRIIESGTAAIFQSPQTSRFAEFLMH